MADPNNAQSTRMFGTVRSDGVIVNESPGLSPKLINSVLAGAIVTIFMWLLHLWKPDLDIPEGVSGAMVLIVTAVMAYLTPPGGFRGADAVSGTSNTSATAVGVDIVPPRSDTLSGSAHAFALLFIGLAAVAALTACTTGTGATVVTPAATSAASDPAFQIRTICRAYPEALTQLAVQMNKGELQPDEVSQVENARTVLNPICQNPNPPASTDVLTQAENALIQLQGLSAQHHTGAQ